MCYAKPGPRCAPHAREDFGKAVNALQEYAETGIGDAVALSATLKTARTDYYGTDEGKQSALDKAERFEAQGRKDKADLIRGHVDEAVAHRAMRMKMYEQVQANKISVDRSTQQRLNSDEGRGLSSDTRGKEVGYPRPRAPLSGYDEDKDERLPIPWIATTPESTLTRAGWTGFEENKALTAHRDRLCQVCGKKVIGKMVHLNTRRLPPGHPSTPQGMETSGSGMHAKCALVALKHCPHFNGKSSGEAKALEDSMPVGFGWSEKGQGYVSMLDNDPEELDRLLKTRERNGIIDIESDYPKAREDAQVLTIGDIKKLAKEESADARAQQSRTTAA